MIKYSIVIPCYNEEKNIPLILDRFGSIINRDDIEVILVDNGSKDNSAELLERLLPSYPFARKVKVEVNQGYGFGIVSGLHEAKGEFIGYTHADMQTDPADVIKGIDILESQQKPEMCFIKGNRKGRSVFDMFFTVGMGIFESVYMGKLLWDINAQPNIFHAKFFKGLSNVPKDFSLDLFLLYTAKKSGLRICRFDVVFPPRIHGSSSWNTGLRAKWKFIKRTIEFSLRLKKEI